MPSDPLDPTTLAALDQERGGVDRLADLLVHLDRRLADGGIGELRRTEMVGRWLDHRLTEMSDDGA
jgi:hypothetical protein